MIANGEWKTIVVGMSIRVTMITCKPLSSGGQSSELSVSFTGLSRCRRDRGSCLMFVCRTLVLPLKGTIIIICVNSSTQPTRTFVTRTNSRANHSLHTSCARRTDRLKTGAGLRMGNNLALIQASGFQNTQVLLVVSRYFSFGGRLRLNSQLVGLFVCMFVYLCES